MKPLTIVAFSLVALSKAATLHNCAGSCISKAIASTGCSSADSTCLCSSDSFISTIEECVPESCTHEERKHAVDVAKKLCSKVDLVKREAEADAWVGKPTCGWWDGWTGKCKDDKPREGSHPEGNHDAKKHAWWTHWGKHWYPHPPEGHGKPGEEHWMPEAHGYPKRPAHAKPEEPCDDDDPKKPHKAPAAYSEPPAPSYPSGTIAPYSTIMGYPSPDPTVIPIGTILPPPNTIPWPSQTASWSTVIAWGPSSTVISWGSSSTVLPWSPSSTVLPWSPSSTVLPWGPSSTVAGWGSSQTVWGPSSTIWQPSNTIWQGPSQTAGAWIPGNTILPIP